MYMYKKGFTLIELIVVMAIFAILVALGVSSFKSSQMKGRDSRRKAELKNVVAAMELFYNDKGMYPNDNGAGKISGCYPDDLTLCDWGSEFKDRNNTLYMTILPTDPLTSSTYYYDVQGGTNSTFQLYARLENKKDPDVPISGTTAQAYSGVSCGSKLCNYGIASTNTTAATGRTLVNDP